MSSTYLGWSNYETWAIALWLDNEESTYRHTRQMARDVADLDDATHGLASDLKDMIDEATPDLGATVFADLLSASLHAVDWLEIAESILKEVRDENDS